LNELNDYGFFRETAEKSSLFESKKPVIIRLYHNQNDVLQNALASFILLNLYQNMFIRGEQKKLSHAIIFDEAHRASRLKLLPTMAKECRKYGVSLVVASQAARDFDPSLFSAIANYLVLRVTESDAKTLAKSVTNSHNTSRIIDQMKQLRKYSAMFFTGGITQNTINLNQIEDMI
jgi:DNA helicase HerA-like ATPase